jgi:photosystem II stability/assembly factor-like uncharacterized protein
MKNFQHSVLIVFLLSSVAASSSAQWTVISNIGSSGDHFGALCYKDGILWAATNGIYMSTDLGKTWVTRGGGISPTFYGIDFYDQQIGAVGSNSYVYITRDAGLSWTSALSAGSEVISVRYGLNPSDVFVATERSRLYVSHDGGVTWKEQSALPWTEDFMNLPDGSSMTFESDWPQPNVGWLYHSYDHGDTWNQLPGSVEADSWSFGVSGCDLNTYYVVNEQLAGVQKDESHFWVTWDGGTNWSNTLSLNTQEMKGAIATAGHCVFLPTLSSGIMRSTDLGKTWKSIGGPEISFDSRLIAAISENEIITVGVAGDVYYTRNSGGDSVKAIGTAPIQFNSIDQSFLPATCTDLDTAVYLATGACSAGGTLEKLSLKGSPAFALLDTAGLPRALSTYDSIKLRYTGVSGAKDTAYLTVTWSTGGRVSDTLITLIGSGQNAFMAMSRSLGTLIAQPYSTVKVSIGAILPASYSAITRKIRSIKYILSFDSNLLDLLPTKLLQLITPPVGWSVSAATITPGLLAVTLSNATGAAIADQLDLGSVLFSTFPAQEHSTLITFQKLELQDSTETSDFCISSEGDFIANVVIGSAGVASAGVQSDFQLFPDPVSRGGNAHLQLSFARSSEFSVAVYDVLGRVVAKESFGIFLPGAHEIDLPLTGLIAGTYYLRSMIDGQVMTRKLTIR